MNHRNVRRVVLASLGLLVSHAALCDAVDTPIPGRIHMIRPGTFEKMVAKPAGGPFYLPAPNSPGDPISNGGSLEIRDSAGGGGSVTYGLSGANKWRGLGNPPGLKGYKYRGAGSGAEPCKIVLLRESVIKFVCFGAGLTPPFGGTSQITLTTGTDSYCAEFGGTTTKNDGALLKRKDAPAPPSCPFVSCCGGKQGVKLTTTNTPGDCGDLVDQFGMLYGNVSCGGLYIGGGLNSVPLPVKVPDATDFVTKFVGCTGGNTATLGAATVAETGSNRNCTELGCLFGAPQPIPNSMSTPSSVCVVSHIATAPTGTLNCLNSVTNVDLGITAELFLTGDTATDPGDTIAGIQPCPLCSGTTCIGGANNGMSCMPGTGNLGSEFPTSQDCPPTASQSIGSLLVAFAFRTGTVTWTAVPSAAQPRVFAGYCHDADTTLSFQGPPAVKCLENGMVVGGGCTQPFEACHQLNSGAFGPNAGSVMTITVVGSSGGDLTAGPQPTKLVSLFAIAPTYNATVDNAAALPGPGAIAIPGIAALCPTLSSCP